MVSKAATQEVVPQEFAVTGVREIRGDDGKVLAYVTELEPEGFIITAADTDIQPILGYSFKGKFPFKDSKQNVLLHLVQWDVEARLKALSSDANEVQVVAQSNNDLWDTYTSADEDIVHPLSSSTQWPYRYWCPACTHRQLGLGACEQCGTAVEEKPGWITTQWDQGGHYNDQCPLLSIGGNTRCAVGCVATSIAQIVNYWASPSSVSFSADDSYISRGNAGSIDIDGDSTQRDFPDFGELNAALSTINYSGNNAEEAYLCFAAGIKAHMDYGSQSGTILSSGVYRDGFDYGSAQVKYQSGNLWSSYEDKVIENIKDGWPVQIGIQESGRRGGHSVIVDGYKTTGDLHFWINYGWGGTNDTWYNPPNINNYDLVTQIVFNICPYQGWNQWGADEKNTFRTVYVAPTTNPPADKWQRTCPSTHYFKGLVVGTGNNIYASCSPRFQNESYIGSVWVVNQYGIKENEIVLTGENEGITYPVQDKNGRVFVATGLGNVWKINTRTDTATKIFTEPSGAQLFHPPKIDDNYIYVCTFDNLYCLNSYGTVLWTFPAPSGTQFFRRIPAIDTERNRVYIGYYNSSTDTSYLGCINRSTGSLICPKTFADIPLASRSTGTPSIGPDGTIYVGCRTKLYALNPDSTLSEKWVKDTVVSIISQPPAVSLDGNTLYFSYWKQVGETWYLTVGALDATNKNTRWEIDRTAGDYDNIGDIYISGNNVVSYTFSAENGSDPDTYTVYAYRDNGGTYEYLWEKEFGESGGMTAFGPGATLYVIPSSGYGHTISAISEGDVGDPDGGGMGFTDNSAPLMPSNPTPADEANDIGSVVTLSWTCSDPEAHTLKYSLFVGESGYDMVPVATGITDTSYALSGLKPNTGYAWKIIATDGQTVSEGPTWVFATEPPNCDLFADGVVNFFDYAILARNWLDKDCNDPNWCEGADLDFSTVVDFNDLQIFVSNWLAVNEPQVPESVVAYWSCNEGSGTILTDDSGNGHDGSINGATWVDGVSGKALSFDGSGDYVGLPSSSGLSFNTPSETFSTSFWIKPDSVIPSDQTILENEDDYIVYLDGGVLSYLKTDYGNLYHNCWHSTNPEISAGTWSHIAITYDGTGAGGTKMYVNGEEKPVTNTSYHGGGSASGDNFAIGIRAFDFASGSYGGKIDEVLIYNRALTATEVQYLYENH